MKGSKFYTANKIVDRVWQLADIWYESDISHTDLEKLKSEAFSAGVALSD